jgi:hypothetical protein
MEHNLKHTNCKYFILHISYLKRSEATFCERDSSGTTEAHEGEARNARR